MTQPPLAPGRIPVTVICGFLGAGKTTLLKRILEAPDGVRFGVLVNDFGTINIDAGLIVETGADQISLANGCICCSIRDDLVEAASRILASNPPPDRLIVEASGVSRPLAILDALERPELAQRIAIDATLCLVDADQFPGLDYASSELAIDQAVSSDLLILNKCDIAAPADIAATEATLTGPMPSVRRIRTAFAHVPREILFGFDRAGEASRPRLEHAEHHGHHQTHSGGDGHDHHHDHTDEFESWSWTCEGAIDGEAFGAAVRQLPAGLLRAKGILRGRIGDADRRVVFHLVGKRHAVTVEDGGAPASSHVVAIARRGKLDRDALTRLFDGCRAK